MTSTGSPAPPGPHSGPTHRDLDARSLAMHRLIAEKLRRDPELLERAKEILRRWRHIGDQSTRIYDDEWERVLDEGLEATVRLLLDESEHGAALRQGAPFAGILSARERWAFLREWRTRHASR